MGIVFKKAVREDTKLIIGLTGTSGCGKTLSALKIAKGISGGKRFAFIDSEARRGLHYADDFDFDHGDFRPPFRPQAYEDAIVSADKAGYPVIVVDSFSHEQEGDGGLVDYHTDELERMSKGDWKRAEACKILAWAKPKGDHKKMMQKLLQLRSHLILCFRSKETLVIGNKSGKKSYDSETTPICEKGMKYELTMFLQLFAENPGYPTMPLKLNEQHKAFFNPKVRISEQTGVDLAAWCTAKPKAKPKPAPAKKEETKPDQGPILPQEVSQPPDAPDISIPDMLDEIKTYVDLHGNQTIKNIDKFCKEEIAVFGGWPDAKKNASVLKQILDELNADGSVLLPVKE